MSIGSRLDRLEKHVSVKPRLTWSWSDLVTAALTGAPLGPPRRVLRASEPDRLALWCELTEEAISRPRPAAEAN